MGTTADLREAQNADLGTVSYDTQGGVTDGASPETGVSRLTDLEEPKTDFFEVTPMLEEPGFLGRAHGWER